MQMHIEGSVESSMYTGSNNKSESEQQTDCWKVASITYFIYGWFKV